MAVKKTLLEITQEILSAMESDEVNSIGDTVESLQVAGEVANTFYDLVANNDMPSNESLISLEPLSDPSRPNILRIPDNVKNIKWVKYDMFTEGLTDYQDVEYREPELFLRYATVYAGSQPHLLVDKLKIGTDTNPRYWTTFDNEHLVFDSYNAALDASLQESKSLAWGTTYPAFEMADNFVPPLDAQMFPLLIAEAKKACFLNFKGMMNANEERRARRQEVRIQADLWRADQRRPYNRFPNYARPSR